MESFWEKVVDILLTCLKAFAIVLAIRVLFLLMDIPFPIPYVDDVLFYILGKIAEVVPMLDFQRS